MTETVQRRRRLTTCLSDVSAGCFECPDKIWITSAAQAMAARHHDHTGHATWCLINRTIRYGEAPKLDGESTETRSAA